MSAVNPDPVRLRLFDAMERRAAGYDGATRRAIEERIAALRAGLHAGGGPRSHAGQLPGVTPGSQSALAGLVAHIAQRSEARVGAAPAPGGHGQAGSAAGPESLAYFRSTWSRLSAERRLTRSLATVPENAGPLNSHQLVHRALRLMRETSPGYLHHFMTHVDALLWLDEAGGAASPVSAPAGRARPAKKGRAGGPGG